MIQTPPLIDFSRGELSPQVFGRFDQPWYYQGVAECTNFLITGRGSISRRSGTWYSGVNLDAETRLIPFVIDDNNKFLIAHQGAADTTIIDVSDHSTATITGLPYTTAHMWDVKWIQQGIQMFLVHPSYAPRILQYNRTAGTWISGTMDFSVRAWVSTGAVVYAADPTLSGTELAFAYATVASANYYPAGSLIRYDDGGGADIYRALQDEYGFIAPDEVASGADYWEEVTVDAETPFSGAGNYPGAVAWHQGRLIFGGTDNEPNTLWGSASGNPWNFITGAYAADSWSFALASEHPNRIKWIMSANDLLVGTDAAEWRIAGGNEGITSYAVSAIRQTTFGSNRLQPLLMGDTVLFAQRAGERIRDYRYSDVQAAYYSQDISLLSEHITLGGIVDWDYAQDPESIVWMVRDDGTLVGLTYEKTNGVLAWHKHETEGTFESVAVVPNEGDYDRVYAIVKRSSTESVTYDCDGVEDTFEITLAYSEAANLKVMWYDDSAGTTTRLVDGTGYNIVGEDIVTTSTLPSADTLTISRENYVLEYFAPAKFSILYEDDDRMYHDGLFVDCAMLNADIEADIMDGETIVPINTGNVGADATYTDGDAVTYPTISTLPAAVTEQKLIGYPYTSTMKTMPIEVQAPNGGPGHLRTKRVVRFRARFYQTLGAKVGPDADNLETILFRTSAMAMGTAPKLFTGVKESHFRGDYEKDAQLMVIQEQAYPCSVLNILPDVQVEG